MTLYKVLLNAEHNLQSSFLNIQKIGLNQLQNIVEQIDRTNNYDLMQELTEPGTFGAKG